MSEGGLKWRWSGTSDSAWHWLAQTSGFAQRATAHRRTPGYLERLVDGNTAFQPPSDGESNGRHHGVQVNMSLRHCVT
jgi:hypothetical protein